MLHTPICGFFRSSSVKPIPYNIACAAGCVGSCVIVFEYLFSSFISFLCYQLYYYYHLLLRRTLVLSILYSPIIPRVIIQWLLCASLCPPVSVVQKNLL